MSLRKNLSDAVRSAKQQSGFTYDEVVEKVGCSKSSVRYALNGGDKVGLDLMEKMLKAMQYYVVLEIEHFYGTDEYYDE